MYSFGEKAIKDFFLKNGGAILPIVGIALDKGPSVYVADIRFSVGPQQIEATYFLLKLLHYSITNKFFIWGEHNRVSNFFSFLISLDDSI